MRTTIISVLAASMFGAVALQAIEAPSETAKDAPTESGASTNSLANRFEKIKETGDLKVIGQWLKDTEALWPAQSATYKKLMDRAIPVLDERIGAILMAPRVQGDRQSLLKFAERLGDVRALRIPGYDYSGGGNASIVWGDNLTPEMKKMRDEFYQRLTHNNLMNWLQQSLESRDESGTRYVLEEASAYLRSHPNDLTFAQEVAKLARLTKEEQEQLEAASKPKE